MGVKKDFKKPFEEKQWSILRGKVSNACQNSWLLLLVTSVGKTIYVLCGNELTMTW